MSIATDEAKQYFPTQYWPHMEPKGDYTGKECYIEGVKSSDIQEAYEMGRTAEPTEAEVDASAFAQFKVANNNSSWRLTEEQYREAWDALPDAVSDDFLRKARIGLDAARKVVTE